MKRNAGEWEGSVMVPIFKGKGMHGVVVRIGV